MSLCKLHTVKAARKPQGNCGRCGTAIEPGDGYRWWQGRYTSKRVRCLKPGCTPAEWERETNPLRQEHMQAETALGHLAVASSPQSASELLTEAIDIVQGITSGLEERLSSWQGTGLENSDQYSACEQSKEALDDWASDAGSTRDELDRLTDSEPIERDYLDPYALEDARAVWDTDYEAILSGLEDLPELDLGA